MQAAARVPRRQNSNSTRADDPPSPVAAMAIEEDFDPALDGADDDGDKTLYCFCQRVSFGEMIACDAPDCEHEWVRRLVDLELSAWALTLRNLSDSPCLSTVCSSTCRASASRASPTAAGSATSAGCVHSRLAARPRTRLLTDWFSRLAAHVQGWQEKAVVSTSRGVLVVAGGCNPSCLLSGCRARAVRPREKPERSAFCTVSVANAEERPRLLTDPDAEGTRVSA